MRKIFLRIFGKLLAPGYGTCKFCGIPWKFVDPMDIYLPSGTGYFATCEECFRVHSADDIFSKFENSNRKYWGLPYSEMLEIYTIIRQIKGEYESKRTD